MNKNKVIFFNINVNSNTINDAYQPSPPVENCYGGQLSCKTGCISVL